MYANTRTKAIVASARSESVFRHVRIDLIRPRVDSAFEIINFCESALLQQPHCLCTAHPAMTMNYDRPLALQLIQSFRNFSQGNQFRAVNSSDFVFEGFAHID